MRLSPNAVFTSLNPTPPGHSHWPKRRPSSEPTSMKRTAVPDPLVTGLISQCLTSDLPPEQRQAQLKALRQDSPALAELIDRCMLEHLDHTRAGLREAQRIQVELKALVDKVMATPWSSAIFIAPMAILPE